MNHALNCLGLLRIARMAALPALLLIICPAHAAAPSEQYSTVAGPLTLSHPPATPSVLQLPRQQVQLPADWRHPGVSSTLTLANETVLLMNYGSAGCQAHTALMVVSANGMHGPYRLPGCNDMLALQRSDDGQSLSILRLGKTPLQSWTYSSLDQHLQGPGTSTASLPTALRQLAVSSAPRAPGKSRSVARRTLPSVPRMPATTPPTVTAKPGAAPSARPVPANTRRTLTLDLTTDLPETP